VTVSISENANFITMIRIDHMYYCKRFYIQIFIRLLLNEIFSIMSVHGIYGIGRVYLLVLLWNIFRKNIINVHQTSLCAY